MKLVNTFYNIGEFNYEKEAYKERRNYEKS